MSSNHDGRGAPNAGTGRDGHATHDPELIARFVGGDATGVDESRARERVATCPDCALLAADLAAIARATADLPAVRRRRDFRISPEQAADLRRSGVAARLIGLLSGRSDRPFVPLQRLAGATAAIGIVMALVTSPVGLAALSPGHAATTAGRPATAPAMTSQGGLLGAAPEPASATASAASAQVASTPPPAGNVAPAASPAGPLFQAPGVRTATAGPTAAATAAAGSGSAIGPVPPAASARPGSGSTGRATDTSGKSTASAGASNPAALGAYGGAEPRSSGTLARAPGPPFQPWEAWLVVAGAAAAAFVALHLVARRAS